jgi:hypothetical protein
MIDSISVLIYAPIFSTYILYVDLDLSVYSATPLPRCFAAPACLVHTLRARLIPFCNAHIVAEGCAMGCDASAEFSGGSSTGLRTPGAVGLLFLEDGNIGECAISRGAKISPIS